MKTFFFFFWRALALVSLVLGLGLEHSCPWPRECLSSERLSLALASDFFCVLGLGLEPCVLDSTSAKFRGENFPIFLRSHFWWNIRFVFLHCSNESYFIFQEIFSQWDTCIPIVCCQVCSRYQRWVQSDAL